MEDDEGGGGDLTEGQSMSIQLVTQLQLPTTVLALSPVTIRWSDQSKPGRNTGSHLICPGHFQDTNCYLKQDKASHPHLLQR